MRLFDGVFSGLDDNTCLTVTNKTPTYFMRLSKTVFGSYVAQLGKKLEVPSQNFLRQE